MLFRGGTGACRIISNRLFLVNITHPVIENKSAESWETVRDLLHFSTGNYLYERQFTSATPITRTTQTIIDFRGSVIYTRQIFIWCAISVMQRIYAAFKYTPGFTTVSTPLSVVMQEKRRVPGFCTYMAIACMHAFGMPVCYVSGYLETMAPEGKENLPVWMLPMHGSRFLFRGWAGWILTHQQPAHHRTIYHDWLGPGLFWYHSAERHYHERRQPRIKVSVDVKRLS